MSFRGRLTIAVAVAVAVAVALASVGAYFAARNELIGQVDSGLASQAETISQLSPDRILGYARPIFGAYYQVVSSSGATQLSAGAQYALPVDSRVKAVAAGTHELYYSDTSLHGVPVRMLTFQYRPGVAIEVVGDVTDISHALGRLQWILLLVALGGVGFAAVLGFVVTRAVLKPVRRLTEATEHVTATRDLSGRMDASGRDELARLAVSFNTMLGALEESVAAQRQLVADASHELRTPLTSLRTNIEVLARADTMEPVEREKLLADVVEQLTEMSTLVAELVQLARGDQPAGELEEIRLDELVAEAVDRARRNAPGIVFTAHLDETTIEGVPTTIERAVSNLLDNAAKWSPAGGAVEVVVRDGVVTVRDHGQGIDEADLPHVFDRFYRAPSARGMPGSGLGLAIVRQVARAHGGEVTAERAEGGGTMMRLRLLASV
jgi:two-component system sensor histidine kinase MprB